MASKEHIGEYVSTSSLSLHPKNPRRNDMAVEEIANSIKRFGFTSPIVANADGVVLCGNTRLKASRKLGLDTVPVIYVDLSPTDAELLMIADNKLGERAEWDIEMLSSLLSELDEAGENIDGLGFDDDELASLLDSVIETPEKPEPEDELEIDKDREPASKIGEVYTLGRHRLFCGDSTNAENWKTLLNGDSVDMVFTDPPYGMFLNVEYDNMFSKDETRAFNTGNRFEPVIGDADDFRPELITAIFDIFPEVKEMFLFGADYYAEHIPEKNAGSWLIWDKRVSENMDKVVGSVFETCWTRAKHKREIIRSLWSGFQGMSGEDSKSRIHPTQKPTKLITWIFERYGQKEDIVADFYGGSGSTLIACEMNERACRMIELSPEYCDVIRRRWRNYAVKHGLEIGDGIE